MTDIPHTIHMLIHRYLYLLGGRPSYKRAIVEHYDEVWRFDLVTKQWKLLEPSASTSATAGGGGGGGSSRQQPVSVPLNHPSNVSIVADVILDGKWFVILNEEHKPFLFARLVNPFF